MPHATTEDPAPGAVSMNQTLKTGGAMEKAVKPEAISSIETRQPAQAPINPHIEAQSRALREKADNQTADEPFDLIVVREGDSLSWIIEENLGDFEEMLPLVLQANTQIRNPNLIMPGWVIRLPRHFRPKNPAAQNTEFRQSVKTANDSQSLEHSLEH